MKTDVVTSRLANRVGASSARARLAVSVNQAACEHRDRVGQDAQPGAAGRKGPKGERACPQTFGRRVAVAVLQGTGHGSHRAHDGQGHAGQARGLRGTLPGGALGGAGSGRGVFLCREIILYLTL